MKPLNVAVLVSLAAAHAAMAQAPAVTRAQSIRGQVIDAREGTPLRRARVVLSSGGTRMEPTFTDDRGWFDIPITLAPPVTVRTSKAGYAPALATIPDRKSAADLRFSLARSAAVNGRVRDLYGSPVANAFVTGRLILPRGSAAPATPTQFFTQSDGLGEYRLGSLPAGRYDVTAVRVRPEARGPGARVEDQLFGSADDLEVATDVFELILSAGDELRDVDFTLPEASETCPGGPTSRPAPGTVRASIRGRVMGPGGEPLSCASVRVVTPQVSMLAVQTDRQGRYSIENLPAGAFVLEARKINFFVALQYGQRHPSDAETPVILREGEQRTGIDFILPRASIVTGTVVDEHGEPVEGMTVWAFQLGRLGGRTATVSTVLLPQNTDDRGHYRLFGLTPGTYLVASSNRTPVSMSPDEPARVYAPAYHPGTPDAAAATRIVVDVGQDANGIDIALTPTRTATVSGTVLDAAGAPLAGTVALALSERSGGLSLDPRSVAIGANGRFAIPDVSPGEYVVQGQGRPGASPKFGMQFVRVSDGDPPPLTIVATEQAVLEGRVTTESGVDAGDLGILVSIEPADPDFAPVASSELAHALVARRGANSTLTNTEFRISNVTGPARFVITASACESCYLKSAYVRGTDATDQPFDFGLKGGTYRDIEIVISDGGGAIQGRVTDERDTPATVFSVIVFPTDRDLWFTGSRHVKTGRSEADGSFRVAGLSPGSYFVAAVNRFSSLPLAQGPTDPEVLEQLSARAQRVTLAGRDRRTMNLRLIRR